MSIFKQSAIIFGLKWSLMPLGFITSVLVARAVGPEGKGLLLLLGGLAGAIISFANLGMPFAAIYFYKQGGYTLGEIVATGFFLTVVPISIAFLGFALLSESFVRIFMGTVDTANFQTVWIWVPLVSSLLHMLFSPTDALLIRDNEMKLYGIKAAGTPSIRIVLTLVLALALGWGIIGVLWSDLLAKMIVIGVPLYWLAKNGALGSLRLSLKATKDMLRIGLQRYGINLVAMISKRFDAFLIAGLLSVRDVGFFAIALGLLNILKTIPNATSWPLVSKLLGKEEDKLSQFAQVARIQFMFMLILMIIFAPLVPLFIHIVYGEPFLPATGTVWLILPGVISMPLTISGHAYFTSKGQPGRIIIPFVIATLVQVGINLMLVPQIGVLGGAVAVSANYISMAAMLIFLIVRDSDLRASEIIIMSRKDWSILYGYVMKLLLRQYKRLLAYRKLP
jgi:O-antigen/teichoic acid export membrane protein